MLSFHSKKPQKQDTWRCFINKMPWLDTIIVTVIAFMGLIILYRALKEPLDLLFGGIRSLFSGLIERIKDSGEDTVEVIRYG